MATDSTPKGEGRQTVEVARRGGRLHITHRGTLVAQHDELTGKYQLRLRPEQGLRRLGIGIVQRGGSVF